jgi:hypothetical protein
VITPWYYNGILMKRSFPWEGKNRRIRIIAELTRQKPRPLPAERDLAKTLITVYQSFTDKDDIPKIRKTCIQPTTTLMSRWIKHFFFKYRLQWLISGYVRNTILKQNSFHLWKIKLLVSSLPWHKCFSYRLSERPWHNDFDSGLFRLHVPDFVMGFTVNVTG